MVTLRNKYHDIGNKINTALMGVGIAKKYMEALEGAAAVWAAVDEESRRLDGGGRVLVRTSGTEPLVRVMAEGPTHDDVDAACARIVAVVEEHLA